MSKLADRFPSVAFQLGRENLEIVPKIFFFANFGLSHSPLKCGNSFFFFTSPQKISVWGGPLTRPLFKKTLVMYVLIELWFQNSVAWVFVRTRLKGCVSAISIIAVKKKVFCLFAIRAFLAILAIDLVYVENNSMKSFKFLILGFASCSEKWCHRHFQISHDFLWKGRWMCAETCLIKNISKVSDFLLGVVF